MRNNGEIGITDERLYECVECGVEFSGDELEYGMVCEHCGRELIGVESNWQIHRGYSEIGVCSVDNILEDKRRSGCFGGSRY